MREWYENLNRRDQLLLVPLALTLLLLLLYGLVWSPVSDATARYRAASQGSLAALERMREAVVQIKRGRAAQPQLTGGGRSLSALVDGTLPAHKLVMQRYQPIGDQGAQVWLEDASLHNVIAWLSALEADGGLRLDNVSIVSSAKSGYVKTRVRMTRG